MTDEMSKTELMERISESWERLGRALTPLDETQLGRPGPEGWAIKDHLNHVAGWERGVAWLLSGRSRTEGMGITADEYRELEMDQVNNLIYERNRERSGAEALAALRDAHREMLDALAPLGDADLLRPYTDFDPQQTRFAGRPILGWIVGDTFEHFEEHLGYIQTILAD
jgi:hypothetical protein